MGRRWDRKATDAAIDAVLGPTEVTKPKWGAHGPLWRAGQLNGRPVRAGYDVGGERPFQYLAVDVPYEGGPVLFSVSRGTGRWPAVDEVATGDGSFDADFVCQGVPEEVVRTVLDEPCRERIRSLRPLGPLHLHLNPDDARLRLSHGLVRNKGHDNADEPWPDEAAIERWARFLLDLGDRIAQTQAEMRREVARTQGDAAVAAWEAAAGQAKASMDRTTAMWMAGFVVGLLVLFVVLVLVFAV